MAHTLPRKEKKTTSAPFISFAKRFRVVLGTRKDMHASGGGMNCVICGDICVYHLRFVFVFLWGIPQLQSDWSLSCDHGLDYDR